MRAYEKEEERKQLEQKRNVESGGWKTIEAKVPHNEELNYLLSRLYASFVL